MLASVLASSTALSTPAAVTVPQVSLGTLKVSPVGIGTLNLPLDKTEDATTLGALNAAVAGGVNLIDTAEAYGFGSSEKLTAWAAREGGWGQPDVAFATKFAPVPWREGAESVVEACRASAERLGVEQIDLYQIHFPDIIQPFKAFGLERRKEEEYWDGLARCYELGLCSNVGVSNYGPQLVTRVRRSGALSPGRVRCSLMHLGAHAVPAPHRDRRTRRSRGAACRSSPTRST